MMGYAGKSVKILIIVENLPVPFDTRVWQEANALKNAGYEVAVICPTGKGYEKRYEELNGIHIYRHPLPKEGNGAWGYLVEYSAALFWEFVLAWKIWCKHGIDIIHACNPPDDIFMIGLFYKLFGKKFIFDHHDINPELFETKFGKKGSFYNLLLWLERRTFRAADISLATNESYKEIAIQRGGMDPEKVFIVRSGPNLARMKVLPPEPRLKQGFKYMVGYVGVIGQQEGIDYLLRSIRYLVYEEKRKDILFVLVGGGPALPELKEYAKSLQVEEYVHFLGRVDDQTLLAYLNTADVCVAPDPYTPMNDKSTMNKILEYMSLGKPLVMFDLVEGKYSAQGAALYAMRNDEIDFAKKLVDLLNNEPLKESMGKIGRGRIINELSWEHTSKNLLRAYVFLVKTLK